MTSFCFKCNDRVRFKSNALQLHARSVQPSYGWRIRERDWRRQVSKLLGQELIIHSPLNSPTDTVLTVWAPADFLHWSQKPVDGSSHYLLHVYSYMIEPLDD